MLVLLHGCDQTANDIRDIVGMREGVVTPEQSRARNPLRCWNWFLSENQILGGPEPTEIFYKIKNSLGHEPELEDNLWLAGLSAGGAMAWILFNLYPNLFRGILLHSTASYRLARSLEDGLELMRTGQGTLLKPVPPFSNATKIIEIVHGTDDDRVDPKNADLLETEARGAFPNARVRKHLIRGLGHAWAGGCENMNYSAPGFPSSTQILLGMMAS